MTKVEGIDKDFDYVINLKKGDFMGGDDFNKSSADNEINAFNLRRLARKVRTFLSTRTSLRITSKFDTLLSSRTSKQGINGSQNLP